MRKGTHHSEATRRLMSRQQSGPLNGFYGWQHSPATRARMSRAAMRLWEGSTYRRRQAEGFRRSIERKRAEATQ